MSVSERKGAYGVLPGSERILEYRLRSAERPGLAEMVCDFCRHPGFSFIPVGLKGLGDSQV
jgi:hypothetical protein